MGMGSERGEWGNGEEPNKPNEGDALVMSHIPLTEKNGEGQIDGRVISLHNRSSIIESPYRQEDIGRHRV